MTNPKMELSLEKVAQRLDGAEVTWAVFAGAAATVYGATRPLTDVDILVQAVEGARVAALFPEAQVKRRQDGTRVMKEDWFGQLSVVKLVPFLFPTQWELFSILERFWFDTWCL